MITRISYIKSFGVFKNFVWSAPLPNFREKNIIYGWNYSGKTTLSRIFSSLRDRKLHEKYTSGEFKITCEGTDITNDNIDAFPYPVQVFNAEYVRDNLKWETLESMNAIAFDVGTNVERRNQINANLLSIVEILGNNETKGKISDLQPALDAFKEFEDSKFQTEARKIKNNIFNSLIEFDKSHLKKIRDKVIEQPNNYLIPVENDLIKIKQSAVAANDKAKIPAITYQINFSGLFQKVEEILKTQPAQSEIIDALEGNSSLYAWAKTGLDLHPQGKLETCSLCGNSITKDRYSLLNNYFSNEAAKLRKSIEEARQAIAKEREALTKINLPKSKNDFSEKCQKDFESVMARYSEIKKAYFESLDHLELQLKRKEEGNIFNTLTIQSDISNSQEDLTIFLDDVRNVIAEHNNFVDDFEAMQKNDREKLKNHLVAEFLISEKYSEKETANNIAQQKINEYEIKVEKLKKENEVLEAQLKSIVAGKEALNKYIKLFLNRDDIVIEVNEHDQFILKRGETIAENLSEGEKTAISFAYFLITLESLHKENKLINTIIFIDDPVSSLDANHIAQVYSLINSFFFRESSNEQGQKVIVNCFKQLFISTHNFDFFSFLKDSGKLNRKKNNQSTVEYYLIRRIEKESSTLMPLPKALKRKSEYVYLFEVLYHFHKNGCDANDERYILIPNALRRFCEIYTLLKLPDAEDSFDGRVDKLMGEGHQLKLLHHFSHFTSFDNITKHDELMMNLPGAMEELIVLLEKDPIHFDALKRAINIT